MHKDTRLSADIIIVGSGIGGATVAKELSSTSKKILILEKGSIFSRKHYGRQFRISSFYDKFGLWSRSKEGIVYYRAIMVGGTSIVSCGNGVRSLENEFKNLGIDLSQEFLETEKELGVNPVPDRFIGKGTRSIMNAANKLGISMVPMPKYINFEKCISCGNCVLGCPPGAKWDSLRYLEEAQRKGASLISGINITKVLASGGKTVGVEGYQGRRKIQVSANTVILAAGGLGTPVILQNSGVEAGKKLFLDLFNVTFGLTKDIGATEEPTMAAVSKHDGFILSPFVDCALAFVSAVPLKDIIKVTQRKRMLGIMAKIEDDYIGRVHKNGLVEKTVTAKDLSRLQNGAALSKEILITAGVDPKTISTTITRGAHPGGTAAIGEAVDKNLETKIKSLFVADASVLPATPGLPPILTIVALAKRLGKNIK